MENALKFLAWLNKDKEKEQERIYLLAAPEKNAVDAFKTATVIYGFKYRYFPKKTEKLEYDKTKIPKPKVIEFNEYKKPTLEKISAMHEMPFSANVTKYVEYYNHAKRPITERTHFEKEIIKEQIHAKTTVGRAIEHVGETAIKVEKLRSKFIQNYWITPTAQESRVLRLQQDYFHSTDYRIQTDWSYWLRQGDGFISRGVNRVDYTRLPPNDGYIRFLRRDLYMYGLYNSPPGGSRLYDNFNWKKDFWNESRYDAGLWYDVTKKVKRVKSKRECWQAANWRERSFDPVEGPGRDINNWNYIYRTDSVRRVSRTEIVADVKYSELQKFIMHKHEKRLFSVHEDLYFSDFRFFQYKLFETYLYNLESAFKRMFSIYRYHEFVTPVASHHRIHVWKFYWRAWKMWDSYTFAWFDVLPTTIGTFLVLWMLFIEWPKFVYKYFTLNDIDSRTKFRIKGGVRRQYPAKISTNLLIAINNIPVQYREVGDWQRNLRMWRHVYEGHTMLKRALHRGAHLSNKLCCLFPLAIVRNFKYGQSEALV